MKDVVTVDNGSDPKAEGDVPVYGSGGRSFKTCGEYKMGPAVLLGRKGTIDVPRFVEGKYWNVDTAFDVKPIGGGHAGRVTLPSDDGRGERPARPQKPDGKIDIRYLFYLAHTFDYKFYSTQTTVPSMTQKDYRNMKIPLPPLPEQRRIAAYLDAKCADVDKAIAAKQRQVEMIETLWKNVLHDATLHGVGSRVPRDRAGRDGVPSPSENTTAGGGTPALPECVSMVGCAGRDGVPSPSENTTAGGGTPALPSGWKVVRLKDVATVDNGSDPKAEGDVPVYGSGGRSFKTCGEYKMGPAVLLGRKGTIDVPFFVEGKYWNVDTAFDVKPIGGGHAGRVTLPSDDGRGGRPARPQKPDGKIDIRYLFYLAHTFDYKFYSTQTTVPSMTQKDYRNMKIPLPPLSEQRQIAAYLDAKRAGFDALAGNLRRQVETLEQYRRSLIHECVTGKRRCA